MTDTDTVLREALARRILVLDGAMGTMIQRRGLSEADFRGARFEKHPRDLKGNTDVLALTRPDVLRSIHGAYFEAGADLAETNTFGATRIVQSEYGLADAAYVRQPSRGSSRARWDPSTRRCRSRPASPIRGSAP
jgi:5-methyltetrahydrofolate--homocysteine methyltransferase